MILAAIGTWFTLVVVGSRAPSTALADLGALFCGSLFGASVFGATTVASPDPIGPRRIDAAALLAAAPAGQFALERRAFAPRCRRIGPIHVIGPASLVAPVRRPCSPRPG